jgi:hypothetical protein
VPTPFQHLVYADRVLRDPALAPHIRYLLKQEIGPYLLGNTAADVQVITGEPRVDTHFYRLRTDHRLLTGPQGSPVAKMLSTLGDLCSLSAAHTAFLAGYAVHLVWDEIWAWDIFVPYYRDSARWPDRKSLFVHHNALRVWLDRQAYRQLQTWPNLVVHLRAVTPHDWLPSAPDWALADWRDWLVTQLIDPGAVQTAEVFAERLHVPVVVLNDLVAEMEDGHYDVVPGLESALARYDAAALAQSLATLEDLLDGEPGRLELALGIADPGSRVA